MENKKKVINNSVVNSVDKLINRKQALNAKVEKLQRFKDFILNKIDNYYTNKIDKILRKLDFNEMQIAQGKEYAQKKLGGK